MNEIFVSDSANAQGEFLWSPLSQYQPAFRFFFCPPNLTNYIVPNQKKKMTILRLLLQYFFLERRLPLAYYWKQSLMRKKFDLTQVFGLSSNGLGIRNLDFGFWKYHEKNGFKKLNKSFLNFFFKLFCCIFDDFSKWSVLQNSFKYAKNLVKNEEKPY